MNRENNLSGEDEKRGILENNAREYFSSGNEELSKKRYNSAVVLFFKCLIALADVYILNKTGEAPSSHNNRFRVLQEKFPEIYDLVDKDFPFYQNSYVQIMNKELAEVIRDDTKVMAEKAEVRL
ncbi:MAG: hypothetical protein WCP89_04300 [archaeon]